MSSRDATGDAAGGLRERRDMNMEAMEHAKRGAKSPAMMKDLDDAFAASDKPLGTATANFSAAEAVMPTVAPGATAPANTRSFGMDTVALRAQVEF